MNVLEIYAGSNGDATKALYDELVKLGSVGVVAVNIFRAQKASERAKVYRGGNKGGRYRDQAYEKKEWSIGNLVLALLTEAETVKFMWGWGLDAKQAVHKHVLYIDLPTGQVSFHTTARGVGPDYPGQWDGVPGQSAGRVVTWVARLMEGKS